MSSWTSVQLTLLGWIQHIRVPVAENLMILLSWAGNYQSYEWISVCVLWVFGARAAVRTGLLAALSVTFTDLFKWLTHEPRPTGYPGVRVLDTGSAGGTSFPSGHALVAAAVYGQLAGLFRRLPKAGHERRWQAALRRATIAVCWSMPVLIGFSRLYTGVHWPLDVLAGWLLGYTLFLVGSRERAGTGIWCAILFLVACSPGMPVDTADVLRFVAVLCACAPIARALQPARHAGRGMARLALGIGILMAWQTLLGHMADVSAFGNFPPLQWLAAATQPLLAVFVAKGFARWNL